MTASKAISPTSELLTSVESSHADRGHSLCSASGSERWLNCPGSVALSRSVPPEPSGPHALEGTRCHELSEKILRHWEEGGRNGVDQGFLEALREEYADTHDDDTGFSMVDHAMTYVNMCIDEVEQFDPWVKVAVKIEHRLTFSDDMKMFGTADFFATGERNSVPYGVIVDLKYGKKRVKTEDNSQLAYYAVALKKMSKKKLEKVKIRIVQPRIKHWLSEIEYTVEDLRKWRDVLTFGAEKALLQIGAKNPTLKTGGWCWFCPAREVCPEKVRERLSVFDDGEEYG